MRESHILIDSEADLSNVVYTHTILTFMIFENGEIVHALRLLSCVLPFFFFFFFFSINNMVIKLIDAQKTFFSELIDFEENLQNTSS